MIRAEYDCLLHIGDVILTLSAAGQVIVCFMYMIQYIFRVPTDPESGELQRFRNVVGIVTKCTSACSDLCDKL